MGLQMGTSRNAKELPATYLDCLARVNDEAAARLCSVSEPTNEGDHDNQTQQGAGHKDRCGGQVFARQANINNGGQQQVNNGGTPSVPPAANFSTEQTELLETSDGQRLDTGTQSKAGRVDPHLEAVGKVHRAAQR